MTSVDLHHDQMAGSSAGRPTTTRRRRRLGRTNWPLTVLLILASLTVLAPLWVTLSMAFKTSAQSVDGNAFSFPAPFNPATDKK